MLRRHTTSPDLKLGVTMHRDTSTMYFNEHARDWKTDPLSDDVRAFHRTLPTYDPTRLSELPVLADSLGVGRVFVKDESERLGLPAFKGLGAAYAICKTLARRWDIAPAIPTLKEARERARRDPDLHLIAATDGNHGRAVAHFAALIGVPATIYFPASISSAAKQAIRDEGAVDREVSAPYDDVVQRMLDAARRMGDGAVIVQDTSWEGYSDVPQWIVDGYDTLFIEIDEQLEAAGAERIDVIAVPTGVGSLAQAAVRHYRSSRHRPEIVLVEPVAAPALFESLRRRERVSVPTGETILAGLNCGTPSELAWETLRLGASASVLVTDDAALAAARQLADAGVDAGPCGAAGLAAVASIACSSLLREDAIVVLLNTEGTAANPIERAGSDA